MVLGVLWDHKNGSNYCGEVESSGVMTRMIGFQRLKKHSEKKVKIC